MEFRRVLFRSSLTTTFKAYIKDLVKTAILFHEPRIRMNNITLDDSGEPDGRILIIVAYTINRTNSRANYVFPFYKNRSEERRDGHECVSTFRYRWSQNH